MRTQIAIGTLVGLAMALAVPTTALADHERNDHRAHRERHTDHRRHEHGKHHGAQVRGAYCGASYAHGRRPSGHHQVGWRPSSHHRREAPRYSCRPCSRRFGSYHELRRHVHHAHHVPLWRLPFMLFAAASGHFVYHG